jgi:hypothetical protein
MLTIGGASPYVGPKRDRAMQALAAITIIVGNAFLLWAGVHFGSKWIDKMLHFEPIDLNKPIVRRYRSPGQ